MLRLLAGTPFELTDQLPPGAFSGAEILFQAAHFAAAFGELSLELGDLVRVALLELLGLLGQSSIALGELARDPTELAGFVARVRAQIRSLSAQRAELGASCAEL